jgi:transposase
MCFPDIARCFGRSSITTRSHLNLRPAGPNGYKADRKESCDEPTRIRTNCRAIIEDRATHPEAEAFEKGWTQGGRGSPLLRWQSASASQQCTLEGSSCKVPVARDMRASIAGGGGRGRLAPSLATLPRVTRQREHPAAGRDVQRWDVLACERRGADIGKTESGKGSKHMVLADGRGVLLGGRIAPAEVTLPESTLEQRAVPRSGPGRPRTNPRRLIYDKAADSDTLRLRFKKRGIESICPPRSNRNRPMRQDGRSLRCCRRRWTVERIVTLLGNFGRLVVRYELNSEMLLAFLTAACLLITLRQL